MKQILITFILLGLAANRIHADSVSGDCKGPEHTRKENKSWIYDISYPKLSNAFVECSVRKWINNEVDDFADDPTELDPKMHRKNETSITYEKFKSRNSESVVLEIYEYSQGAHGGTEVKSFTYDVKTGKAYKLFDVLNDKKDWLKVLMPFIVKRGEELETPITIDADQPKSEVFKSFAIDNGDLVFYFDECEVASCSMGVINVSIPLAKIRDILKPSFAN